MGWLFRIFHRKPKTKAPITTPARQAQASGARSSVVPAEDGFLNPLHPFSPLSPWNPMHHTPVSCSEPAPVDTSSAWTSSDTCSSSSSYDSSSSSSDSSSGGSWD